MIRTMVNGFCMALADSVPGVSGGTIAFIMGFYERLLDAVHGVFRGSRVERRNSILYLLKLGCGWILGMTLSLLLLSRILDSGIYILSSAFIGLTLVSIPLVIYSEWDVMRGQGNMLLFTVAGLALVIGITAEIHAGASQSLDFASLELWQYLFVFVAGAIASSAMILPGISGSTLLLVFGVYAPMILAFHQAAGLQLAVVPGLCVLAAGIVCGLAVSIGLVRRLLKRHRAAMMYFIVGLMGGSLFSIVQGPTTMSVPQAPLTLQSFSIVACLVGAGVVLGLELLSRRLASKRGASDSHAAANEARGA
jgi:putative membrane protein